MTQCKKKGWKEKLFRVEDRGGPIIRFVWEDIPLNILIHAILILDIYKVIIWRSAHAGLSLKNITLKEIG